MSVIKRNKPVWLRMTEAQHAKLKAMADAEGVTISDVLYDALLRAIPELKRRGA